LLREASLLSDLRTRTRMCHDRATARKYL